ncbi:MAG: hypothetical protein II132_02625 [Desulfovibrio sp.]|nr:hypothetical protein [Desulfovibrio sp.]
MPLATFSIGGESFSEQRCQRKNKTCYASKTGIFEELFKRDVSEMPHIARPRCFAPFPRPQKQTGWTPPCAKRWGRSKPSAAQLDCPPA